MGGHLVGHFGRAVESALGQGKIARVTCKYGRERSSQKAIHSLNINSMGRKKAKRGQWHILGASAVI